MLDKICCKFVKSISLEYPTAQKLIIDYRPIMSIAAVPLAIIISALFLAICSFNYFNATIIEKIIISFVVFVSVLSINVPVLILVPWQILCVFDLEKNLLIINYKVFTSENISKHILKDIRVARIENNRKYHHSEDDESTTIVEQYEIILYGELGKKISLFGTHAHFLSSKRQDYERILRHIKSFLEIQS